MKSKKINSYIIGEIVEGKKDVIVKGTFDWNQKNIKQESFSEDIYK